MTTTDKVNATIATLQSKAAHAYESFKAHGGETTPYNQALAPAAQYYGMYIGYTVAIRELQKAVA
jgi:hypothetical protein